MSTHDMRTAAFPTDHGVGSFSCVPETVCDGIVCIRVPFENIYTSVYVLTAGERCAVLDSASNAEDMERYLFPYLEKQSLSPDNLICSHFHGDHAGGADAVLARYPACKAIGFAEASLFPAERRAQFRTARCLCRRNGCGGSVSRYVYRYTRSHQNVHRYTIAKC